jgi:hypothetical protein
MWTKIIPVIFISIIVYILGALPVRAHDLPGGNPIQVSGYDLEDNTDPQPTKLPWTEHFMNHIFQPKESLTFDLNENRLFGITGTDISELQISWKLESVTRISKTFSYSFSKNGKYVVSVRVASGAKDYFTEDFTVIVGYAPVTESISVDGKTRERRESIVIDRNNSVNFAVVNPDQNFNYFWDLGDADVSNSTQTSKRFLNTKLPAYIILRKQGKNDTLYSDTYVRVDSDQQAQYTVLEPHVTEQPDQNLNSTVQVAVTGIILGGTIIIAFAIRRSSK